MGILPFFQRGDDVTVFDTQIVTSLLHYSGNGRPPVSRFHKCDIDTYQLMANMALILQVSVAWLVSVNPNRGRSMEGLSYRLR